MINIKTSYFISGVTSQSEHQIVKSLAMVPGRNIPVSSKHFFYKNIQMF